MESGALLFAYSIVSVTLTQHRCATLF